MNQLKNKHHLKNSTIYEYLRQIFLKFIEKYVSSQTCSNLVELELAIDKACVVFRQIILKIYKTEQKQHFIDNSEELTASKSEKEKEEEEADNEKNQEEIRAIEEEEEFEEVYLEREEWEKEELDDEVLEQEILRQEEQEKAAQEIDYLLF